MKTFLHVMVLQGYNIGIAVTIENGSMCFKAGFKAARVEQVNKRVEF